MHSHTTCGKCGSKELYRIPVTSGGQSKIVFGDRLLRSVEIRQYVCTDCGYIEQWVNNRADLIELKAVLSGDRSRTTDEI